MSRFWLLPLLALAVVACDSRQHDSQNNAAQAPAAPAPMDQPAQDVPPATAPADGLAHYGGYGDMLFGMTDAETKAAWGGELKGAPAKHQICYYLSPISNPMPSYFAFMIENDKFVRYDVRNDKQQAPGGGKVGMSAAQIEKLYPGRVKSSPHKYVKGGQYLRIKGNDGSGGVLVFETDDAGKVSQWRVGQPPAVDYVEGCS